MPNEVCVKCKAERGRIPVKFGDVEGDICIECFEEMTGIVYDDEDHG